MKLYFIAPVSIILLVGISCKKDNGKDKSPTQPPTEKKCVVSTVAGNGIVGYLDGAVSSAKFKAPFDVAVDGDGTLYITDLGNHRIRKVAAGQVSIFAGNSIEGIRNGNGALAQFEDPYLIAADGAGNLYSLDDGDLRIRKISHNADVSVYTGTDTPGFLDGPIATALFQDNEGGIAADAQGNVYIADTFNGRIRKISSSGQVITIAGSDTPGFRNGHAETAQFNYPGGITVDKNGNLYVVDMGNLCIRKISPDGDVSTFAGSGAPGLTDGDAGVARFSSPFDIVADNDGNLYVTDEERIRKISPLGVVSTIAGSTAGYADGDGAVAKFHSPGGLGIDAQGNIYVADINNNRIRKISFE
jgi:streptogramin lyase